MPILHLLFCGRSQAGKDASAVRLERVSPVGHSAITAVSLRPGRTLPVDENLHV